MPSLAVVQSVGGEPDQHGAAGGCQGDLGYNCAWEPTAGVQTQTAGARTIKHLHTVRRVHREEVKLERQSTVGRVVNTDQTLLIAGVVG